MAKVLHFPLRGLNEFNWEQNSVAALATLMETYRDALLQSLDPTSKDAFKILSLVAQWVDFDRSYFDDLTVLTKRFRSGPLPQNMQVTDLMHLHLARALYHLHRREYETALSELDWVGRQVDNFPRSGHTNFAVVVPYMKARCCWKSGDREQALEHALSAEEQATPHTRSWAVILLLKSWLLFLQAELDAALDALVAAEGVLDIYGDDASRANCRSVRGRIEGGLGNYSEAIKQLWSAIRIFREAGKRSHPDRGRCHTNIARIYRILMKNCLTGTNRSDRDQDSRDAERFYVRAQLHLKRALDIYEGETTVRCRRRIARVYFFAAYLEIDRGERYSKARQWAEKMVRECGRHDALVSARSQIILSICESNSATARRYAQMALKSARQSGHRRLQIRALIQCASVWLDGPSPDHDKARQYVQEAKAKFGASENDYLLEELAVLTRNLQPSITIFPENYRDPNTQMFDKKRAVEDVVRLFINYVMELTRDNKKQAAAMIIGVVERDIRNLHGKKASKTPGNSLSKRVRKGAGRSAKKKTTKRLSKHPGRRSSSKP